MIIIIINQLIQLHIPPEIDDWRWTWLKSFCCLYELSKSLCPVPWVEKWCGEYEWIKPLEVTFGGETALAALNILHIVNDDKSVWCGPWCVFGDESEPVGDELISPVVLLPEATDDIVFPLAKELKLDGTLDGTNWIK